MAGNNGEGLRHTPPAKRTRFMLPLSCQHHIDVWVDLWWF